MAEITFNDAATATSVPSGGDLLALLADLKAEIGTTETVADALLLAKLGESSRRAESAQGCGRELARRTGIIEFPRTPGIWGVQTLRLRRFPIEAITSIIQLYSPGTDADFLAEEALVEDEDFLVDYEHGTIDRIGNVWRCDRPRMIQVEYAGGYLDPSTSPVPAGAILPPADLQHGVILDAIALWRQGPLAGISSVSTPGAGSASLGPLELHPNLKLACERLRRMEI